MFFKDVQSAEDSHTAGLLLMTAASIAITIPFIFYFKSMADSLQTIADERTGYRKAKRYGI